MRGIHLLQKHFYFIIFFQSKTMTQFHKVCKTKYSFLKMNSFGYNLLYFKIKHQKNLIFFVFPTLNLYTGMWMGAFSIMTSFFLITNTLMKPQQRSDLTRRGCVIRATPPQSLSAFNEDTNTHSHRPDQNITAGSNNQGKMKCHVSEKMGGEGLLLWQCLTEG